MQVNIKKLIDDAQCYDTVRELRWQERKKCPFCESHSIIKRGFDEKNLPSSFINAKAVENVSMILPAQFFLDIINLSKFGYCVSTSWD